MQPNIKIEFPFKPQLGLNPRESACGSRVPPQFGDEKQRALGTYEQEEDAARAFDKVARILRRSDLNFPNSDAFEIHGPRSGGALSGIRIRIRQGRRI